MTEGGPQRASSSTLRPPDFLSPDAANTGGPNGVVLVRRRTRSFTRAEEIKEQEAKEHKSRQDRP